MLSPMVRQRVKNLQDAKGYDAIMDAIRGWELGTCTTEVLNELALPF